MQGLMCVIDAWIFPLRCSTVLVGCFLNPHSVVFSLTAFPFSLENRPFVVPVFFLPHSLKVSPMPLTSRVIINSGMSIFVCPDKFSL